MNKKQEYWRAKDDKDRFVSLNERGNERDEVLREIWGLGVEAKIQQVLLSNFTIIHERA